MRTFPSIDIRDVARVTGTKLVYGEGEGDKGLEGPGFMRCELQLADGKTLILQTGDDQQVYLVDTVIDVEFSCGNTGVSEKEELSGEEGLVESLVEDVIPLGEGSETTDVRSMAAVASDEPKLLRP